MDEIISAAGGPQYNLLRRLKARGYTIRSEKVGRRTRYFAAAPELPTFEAAVSPSGQLTLPREVRDAMKLGRARKVRFRLADDGTAVVEPVRTSIRDLFGMLGKPPKPGPRTDEEMDEAIAAAAVERYQRSIERK